jgi:hypothetical protein
MTLSQINRMIGRTLRTIQLTVNTNVRLYLNMAMGWLNMARRFVKQGRDPKFALGMAHARMRSAIAIAYV